MRNPSINTGESSNENLTKGNKLDSRTGNIVGILESNDKYRKLEEFEVGGYKVSFGNYKTPNSIYDVYLDGKLCGTIVASYGIRYSSLKLIGNDIYFCNEDRHGSFFERIKDGKIDKLENEVEVHNVNGKPLYIERTENNGVYRVVLGDKNFGEYKLIYDMNGNLVNGSSNSKFSFEIDRDGNFGFIGKKVNGKEVFVTEDYISDEFDEIDFNTSGNYLTMIGKTYTTKAFPELKQNRHC